MSKPKNPDNTSFCDLIFLGKPKKYDVKIKNLKIF